MYRYTLENSFGVCYYYYLNKNILVPFKRILVPFDNSKLSFKAVEQAIELTQDKPAEIFILHVISEILLPFRYSKIEPKNDGVIITPLVNQIYDDIRIEMTSILEDVRQIYKKPHISINIEIEIGDPAETIVHFVRKYNIDLIVIGSVGHKGISGMFRRLGSVSRRVAEDVSCPIFIVR